MDNHQELLDRFERDRPRLRAVASRLLGSAADAEDAVQDAWIRLSHADAAAIENLEGWLTTVVARICLDRLRARRIQHAESLDVRLVDTRPVDDADDPQRLALLADAVGEAMTLVLDLLAPAERLAFILHDVFGMPFPELAAIVDRTPEATRQLASRARRRVRTLMPGVGARRAQDRQTVDAFLAAARDGNFAALLEVLDPDVVFVQEGPGTMRVVRGSSEVARQASFGAQRGLTIAAAVHGESPAIVIFGRAGEPSAVMSFETADGRITSLRLSNDPALLRGLARG